jgi:hypothetical protein
MKLRKKKFLKKKEKLESTESICPNQDPCQENVTIQQINIKIKKILIEKSKKKQKNKILFIMSSNL